MLQRLLHWFHNFILAENGRISYWCLIKGFFREFYCKIRLASHFASLRKMEDEAFEYTNDEFFYQEKETEKKKV